MLTESQVIRAVCGYLEKRGYEITQCLSETEHGVDIKATTPNGTKITVEAKGETSSKSFTSRFGKPFDSKQVKSHVSRAFYAASRDFSTGIEAGIALPNTKAHQDCVLKILAALRHLGIEVFWVSPDDTVEVVGIWKLWALSK